MLRKWSTIACSDQSQNAHCTINEPHKHYTFSRRFDAYRGAMVVKLSFFFLSLSLVLVCAEFGGYWYWQLCWKGSRCEGFFFLSFSCVLLLPILTRCFSPPFCGVFRDSGPQDLRQ